MAVNNLFGFGRIGFVNMPGAAEAQVHEYFVLQLGTELKAAVCRVEFSLLTTKNAALHPKMLVDASAAT